jgi:hypothetical protein
MIATARNRSPKAAGRTDPPSDQQRNVSQPHPRDRAQELGRQQGLRHHQYQQRWTHEASLARRSDGSIQPPPTRAETGHAGDARR